MAEKRIKVEALVDFYDISEKLNRRKGDVFDVSPDRMAELNACGPEQCGAELVRACSIRKAKKEE